MSREPLSNGLLGNFVGVPILIQGYLFYLLDDVLIQIDQQGLSAIGPSAIAILCG